MHPRDLQPTQPMPDQPDAYDEALAQPGTVSIDLTLAEVANLGGLIMSTVSQYELVSLAGPEPGRTHAKKLLPGLREIEARIRKAAQEKWG
jgi:hypothetical protein